MRKLLFWMREILLVYALRFETLATWGEGPMGFYKEEDIMKKCYTSFEEWGKDYERIKQHPHDKHLIDSINNKIQNSEVKLKTEITYYLRNRLLGTKNPWPAFDKIMKEKPHLSFVCKSDDDPWFIC